MMQVLVLILVILLSSHAFQVRITLFQSKNSATRLFCEAKSPKVVIEYCPGCKWMLRSAYYAQELLTTFEDSLAEVALKPSRESGTFTIKVDNNLIWDRRSPETAGFPEIKTLKQLVRDVVAPSKSLGHSDKKTSE